MFSEKYRQNEFLNVLQQTKPTFSVILKYREKKSPYGGSAAFYPTEDAGLLVCLNLDAPSTSPLSFYLQAEEDSALLPLCQIQATKEERLFAIFLVTLPNTFVLKKSRMIATESGRDDAICFSGTILKHGRCFWGL